MYLPVYGKRSSRIPRWPCTWLIVSVNSAGTSATSADYKPQSVGTYRVVATYSGDTNYPPATTSCSDTTEQATVSQATPSLSTQVSNGGTITIGSSFTDKATISGPSGVVHAAYAGPDTSALIYQGTANLSLAVGRQDWSLSSPVALAAGDYLVVGILATGMSAAPSLSCSPSVSTTLLNQDATVLTAVSTTASTLTALPTSALNLATLTGYNLLGQIPWLAASP